MPFSSGSRSWSICIACICRDGDGCNGLNFARRSLILIWYPFCSMLVVRFMGSYKMHARVRSSSRFCRSIAQSFENANAMPWYIGHASTVKCFSSKPLRWPTESQPSTGHLRSSGTGGTFLGGVCFSFRFFAFAFDFLFGLLDVDRLLSPSESEPSDVLAGVNIAARRGKYTQE